MTYVCTDCNMEFETMPVNDECPICGNLIYKKENVQVNNAPEDPKIRGENGLGIIVMDFSCSMNKPAFPHEIEYTKSKAGIIASALKTSLPQIKTISKADKAYVAMIGFTEDAKLLGVFKAAEINTSVEYWNEWFEKSINNVRNSFGGGTNITSALKLARELYDGALKGDLESYGIHNFTPMYQDIGIKSDTYGKNTYDVANVRVFVYSDGEHCVGPFINYFKDSSLIPGRTNVNGLTSAFLGDVDDEGYKYMEEIAGVCPIHEIKAVIHVNQSKYYNHLRELFHMTSNASGLCIECAKKGKTIGDK